MTGPAVVSEGGNGEMASIGIELGDGFFLFSSHPGKRDLGRSNSSQEESTQPLNFISRLLLLLTLGTIESPSPSTRSGEAGKVTRCVLPSTFPPSARETKRGVSRRRGGQ